MEMSPGSCKPPGASSATDPRGTKLCPDTLYTFPASGPAVGWNQFEFDEPPHVMPLTLPAVVRRKQLTGAEIASTALDRIGVPEAEVGSDIAFAVRKIRAHQHVEGAVTPVLRRGRGGVAPNCAPSPERTCCRCRASSRRVGVHLKPSKFRFMMKLTTPAIASEP